MKSKYRFSLRNQEKIKKALGEMFLNNLLNCLKKYFLETIDIIEIESDKYNIIKIDNFEFYIISKKFDVYNLAYKNN